MTEPTVAPAASPLTFESELPTWQQWVNGFCENWIFAFIIAMGIRHFCIEAFRIPTASMEPMLYGDPAFSKSDHVVVDKFFFRFTGPSRWDVTVFQFPQPEIEPRPGEQSDARTAIAADESRLDRVMFRPLMYRNFVKRAVILPGDRYYIAGGDIYLEQSDKSFQVSRKPKSVQDELWQTVYRFGEQPGYQPWIPSGGAQVRGDDGSLRMTIPEGSSLSLLPDQFRNLYLKPGIFRVRPVKALDDADELIELSMTRPQFTYQRTKRTGVAWDLNSWQVRRLNTAELDNAEMGTLLNNTMTEWVGDVRFTAQIRDLTGKIALEITQGNTHSFRLELTSDGWGIAVDGKEMSTGKDAPVGKTISFCHLDNQIIFTIGEQELYRLDVAPSNPLVQRLGARWSGDGKVAFSSLSMDRDVHYSLGNPRSFLREEAEQYQIDKRNAEMMLNNGYGSAYDRDMTVKYYRDLVTVRSQILGKPVAELTPQEASRAWGYSPETAITAPPGAYLMMGDNSPQSWDSRCWGYVMEENLRGRVLAVILPFKRWRVVR
jgi:signal peptidase I